MRRVNDVQEGSVEEILPKDRKIIQPSRVLTEIVRQKIRQYLESNLEQPRKQRLTEDTTFELIERKPMPLRNRLSLRRYPEIW